MRSVPQRGQCHVRAPTRRLVIASQHGCKCSQHAAAGLAHEAVAGMRGGAAHGVQRGGEQLRPRRGLSPCCRCKRDGRTTQLQPRADRHGTQHKQARFHAPPVRGVCAHPGQQRGREGGARALQHALHGGRHALLAVLLHLPRRLLVRHRAPVRGGAAAQRGGRHGEARGQASQHRVGHQGALQQRVRERGEGLCLQRGVAQRRRERRQPAKVGTRKCRQHECECASVQACVRACMRRSDSAASLPQPRLQARV